MPPAADARNFNENDILGELDRDDKGNIVVLQDSEGNHIDKNRRPTNQRGYLTDKNTGDVLENHGNQVMFPATDLDDKGELPAPFCVEKHNFNPHDLMGSFDYTTGKDG